MAGTKGRQSEFAIYPRYRQNYILAFDRMLAQRRRRGLPTDWKDADECFHWWMEDGILPGQMSIDDLVEMMEEDE